MLIAKEINKKINENNIVVKVEGEIPDFLIKDGWLPLEEIKSTYDPELQRYEFSKYEVKKDAIFKHFKVVPWRTKEQKLSDDNKIKDENKIAKIRGNFTVDDEIKKIKDMIDWLSEANQDSDDPRKKDYDAMQVVINNI